MSPTQFYATRLYATRQFREGGWHPGNDELRLEEPLEIRLDGRLYKTTLRTPGPTPEADLLLAQGLLFSDGIVAALEDFERLEHSTYGHNLDAQTVSVVNATLHDDSEPPEKLSTAVAPLEKVKLNLDLLRQLAEKLKSQRNMPNHKDACHAAAIFDADGAILCSFEDIEPLNATDKALGYGLENYFIPAVEPLILLVSGRVGVEIIQKALVARIQTVCSPAAVSGSAVDLAIRNNLNLIGHLSSQELTVCNGDF
jgi:FdhD protein